MIFDIDKQKPEQPAMICPSGEMISYGEMKNQVERIKKSVNSHTLAVCFCGNVPEAVIGYLAVMDAQAVPLLLDADIGAGIQEKILNVYRPAYLWTPRRKAGEFPAAEELCTLGDYGLYKTSWEPFPLNEKLGLLLTTSGSTGSPKLVRLSRRNLEANAASISSYLQLSPKERPVTTLPMHYTYGLSIINSHLLVGACLLMTDVSMVQQEFWDFFEKEQATSFGGVPYTYEILKRMHFFQRNLPSLTTMTQAGGKLPQSLQQEFGAWAREHRILFYVMYGQTEATARMAYLPPERCLEKLGSIGTAIPGGTFSLKDSGGNRITRHGEAGELIYTGDNVMLGYALCAGDLMNGDECDGVLETGDMAKTDEDGFYYIVGRKKRFIKIFGNRVSLDECEQMLLNRFEDSGFACIGSDDCMEIYTDNAGAAGCAGRWLSEQLHMNEKAFLVYEVTQIPKNSAGKTQYAQLKPMVKR